jgi:hypothetical protein
MARAALPSTLFIVYEIENVNVAQLNFLLTVNKLEKVFFESITYRISEYSFPRQHFSRVGSRDTLPFLRVSLLVRKSAASGPARQRSHPRARSVFRWQTLAGGKYLLRYGTICGTL